MLPSDYTNATMQESALCFTMTSTQLSSTDSPGTTHNKAKTLPVHTIRNIDAYRACAFNGMKAYFYYDEYDKAVEAGAWHLLTLIVIPREGHPKNPSFPPNGATVDRLQRMGQVLGSLEEQRKALLTRTAELLRATDRNLEAEYIESYRSPQMQRILRRLG